MCMRARVCVCGSAGATFHRRSAFGSRQRKAPPARPSSLLFLRPFLSAMSRSASPAGVAAPPKSMDRSRSPARNDAEAGDYKLVAAHSGLRLGKPRMRAEVAQALHELVSECETSDRVLSDAARSLRQAVARSSLEATALQVVEREADRLESEARENPQPYRQAMEKLEACQGNRRGTAQALIDRKEDLRAAQKAVELAEQRDATALCDERQAVADLLRLVRGGAGAAQRQNETAALWRRASERLAMQAEEEGTRAMDLLRILGRTDEDAAAQRSPAKKSTRAADVVLGYLAEARARHAQLARAAEQVHVEGGLL